MKTIDKLRRTLALTVLGVGVLAGLPAQAIVGTAAGTVVTNDVALDYDVAGVSQDQETASTSFEVDRKFDVVVSAVATDYAGSITATNNAVAPGATNQQLLFTVTNQSNFDPDLLLSAFENLSGPDPFGTAGSLGGTNLTTANGGAAVSTLGSDAIQFNEDDSASSCSSTLTGGADGDYLPGANFGNATTTADVTLVCVYVDIPTVNEFSGSPLVNDEDYFAWTLVAGFGDPDDAAGTWLDADDTGVADIESGAGAVQNVFADLTTHDTEDFAYDFVNDTVGATGVEADGQHSDTSAFVVRRAVLDITKTSLTVWDPINGVIDVAATDNSALVGTSYDTFSGTCTTDCPKAIPGGVIQYRIQVENTGSASAESISISDTLAAETSAGVIDSGAGNFLGTDATAAVDDQDGSNTPSILVDRCTAEDAGLGDTLEGYTGGNVSVTLGECGAGETADIYYYVTID